MEEPDFMDLMFNAGKPTVEKKPWMLSKKFVLVNNNTMASVVDECIKSGLYALDLETTGLDSRVFDGRTVDSISGACISPDGETGYYIPVRHPEHESSCVSYSLFKKEMQRLIASDAVAIFHNGKFDHEFLQFCGGDPMGEWDEPKKWEDTLILAYLRDTRAKNKGLKHLAKTELDMEMIELESLFSDEDVERGKLDFGKLDPNWEPTLLYAASDAICTYLLYKKIRSSAIESINGLPSQEWVYLIEKLCVASTRWMERSRIPVDRDRVAELISLGLQEWLPAMTTVYEETSKIFGRDIAPGFFRILSDPGSPYRFDPKAVEKSVMDFVDVARIEAAKKKMDPTEIGEDGKLRIKTIEKAVQKLKSLDSNEKWDPKETELVRFPVVYDILNEDQMGMIFREMGIPGLFATAKSGKVKTSADVIDTIIEEYGEDYPHLKKISRFRKVRHALSTYLTHLYKYTDPMYSPDGRIRINFEAFKIDTGRFCTPGGKDRGEFSGRVPINFHSIPSGKGKDLPVCLKGIRRVFRCGPGRKIYAVDFSAEELRIVTNMSGEPLWVGEFFRCGDCKYEFDRGSNPSPPPPEPPPPFCPKCGSSNIGDLHTLTAIALFGDEIVNDPQFTTYRGYAKGTNFALCYGGGGQAVVRAAGTTLEEGWRIVRKFTATYKGLARWWATQVDFAKKHGCVLTSFNRRYPLPDINHEKGGIQKKAERNAVNGPIQGGGSDLIKFAMGLIYKEVKKRGWLGKVRMILSMHDELVFEIDDDVAEEALLMIKEIMTKKTIARLRWQVPLTCDIEGGEDYSVPYNITKIWWGRDACPKLLEGVINPKKFGGPVSGGPVSGGETQTEKVFEAPVQPIVSDAQAMTLQNTDSPPMKKGEPYVYTITRSQLTMRKMIHLAEVINECRARGTHPLVVKTDGDYPIINGDVMVNPREFEVLINRRREAIL